MKKADSANTKAPTPTTTQVLSCVSQTDLTFNSSLRRSLVDAALPIPESHNIGESITST